MNFVCLVGFACQTNEIYTNNQNLPSTCPLFILQFCKIKPKGAKMVMPISRKYTCKGCGYSMVKISSDCLMPDDLPPLKCPKCGNAKGYETTKPTEFERQMQSIKNVFKF